MPLPPKSRRATPKSGSLREIVFRPYRPIASIQALPSDPKRLPIRCQDFWFVVCRNSALIDPVPCH